MFRTDNAYCVFFFSRLLPLLFFWTRGDAVVRDDPEAATSGPELEKWRAGQGGAMRLEERGRTATREEGEEGRICFTVRMICDARAFSACFYP